MDFEKFIKYRNEKNSFNKRLGIEVIEARLGYAKIRKTIQEDDTNPLGTTHGGVYFTMADSAAGSAATTHGHLVVTLNALYNFYRSASPGDILTAEAIELKFGETISVYDVKVTDQNETLLGSGTFSFYILPQELKL